MCISISAYLKLLFPIPKYFQTIPIYSIAMIVTLKIDQDAISRTSHYQTAVPKHKQQAEAHSLRSLDHQWMKDPQGSHHLEADGLPDEPLNCL